MKINPEKAVGYRVRYETWPKTLHLVITKVDIRNDKIYGREYSSRYNPEGKDTWYSLCSGITDGDKLHDCWYMIDPPKIFKLEEELFEI